MEERAVFGRPVENVHKANQAAVRPLRARQDTTASVTDSAESTASTSDSSETAAASETESAASSSITDTDSADAAATTESAESATTSLPAGLTTDGSGNVVVVTQLISPPPYTATSSTAYKAPGVNATTKTTSSTSYVLYPGLEKTTSTHSTSTSSAPGAWATEFGVPHNILTKCTIDGKNQTFGPFCSPTHHQNLWVGFTYAFTWNPDLFAINATNRVQLQYDDASLGNATVGNDTAAYLGYYSIELPEVWLLGADGNSSWSGQNLTINMITQPADDEPEFVTAGPQVYLVRDPHTLPPVRIKKLPAKYGLEIGLPIGLVALVIIFLSVCCAARRSNRHFSRFKGASKDYMSRRARRRGPMKAGDIQLDEMDLGPQETGFHYTDQPVTGGGNAFRDEIRRQRDEDDQLKRSIHSY